MSPTPTRKPALTRAPVREHPVAPPAPAPVAEQAAPPRTAMLSARVDADLRLAVRRHAVDHGMTVQELVDRAVRAYLDQH